MREIAAVITRIAGASLLGPRKLLSEVLAATFPIRRLPGLDDRFFPLRDVSEVADDTPGTS